MDQKTETALLSGIKILVADDSEDSQLLIKLYLRKFGAEIDSVGDGHACCDQATRRSYDIILMDIQMPELDGYETTRRLRAKGLTIPIVAVTAHAMSDAKEKSLKAGCDSHVTKPLDLKELVSIIFKLTKS